MPDAGTRSSKFRLTQPLGLHEIRELRGLVATNSQLESIDFSGNSKTILVKPAQDAEAGDNAFSGIKGYLTKLGISFEYSVLPECVLQNSQAA